MGIKKITCDYTKLRGDLLPQLRETVFHVTSGEGLVGILAENMILPNSNERFTFSYPQSANSFGVKRDYICLFDLRDISDNIIDETLDRHYFLNHNHWDINVFLILDAEAYGDLIPNEIANGHGEMWIPSVEIWFPGPIPLGKISNRIEVQIKNRPKNISY